MKTSKIFWSPANNPVQTLKLGLVTESEIHQRHLQEILEPCGLTLGQGVVLAALPDSGFGAIDLDGSDAWLIDVDMDKTDEGFERWLDRIEKPVIFGEGLLPEVGSEEFRLWSSRLQAKVSELHGSINLLAGKDKPAERVWVLCASTGGLAAVKIFLDALPAKLESGFIYVQHIDPDHESTLVRMMSRDSQVPAYLAAHGEVFRTGGVAILRPNEQVALLANGTFCVRKEAWPGLYSPSIDQVLANVANIYKKAAGAIIFTGMGEDGVRGSRLIKQHKGKVWAQTPESCIASSMPESVLAQGLVSFTGTPEELAREWISEHCSGA